MPPQRRAYDATGRRHAAEETRRSVLVAAERLFVARGYGATTMPAVADAAGVALDTVYAVVGKKPALFRLLVERAISGEDRPVPPAARTYVKEIRAEPDVRRKLAIYAAAIAAIQPRLAPLFRVLQGAAGHDEGLAAMWSEISERRATNMRDFARDLASTGQLRADLTLDEVADIVFATNSPEMYLLLVKERRWTVERFERWLLDAWTRLLLAG